MSAKRGESDKGTVEKLRRTRSMILRCLPRSRMVRYRLSLGAARSSSSDTTAKGDSWVPSGGLNLDWRCVVGAAAAAEVDAAGVVPSGLFRRRDFGFLGVLRTGCEDCKEEKRKRVEECLLVFEQGYLA